MQRIFVYTGGVTGAEAPVEGVAKDLRSAARGRLPPLYKKINQGPEIDAGNFWGVRDARPERRDFPLIMTNLNFIIVFKGIHEAVLKKDLLQSFLSHRGRDGEHLVVYDGFRKVSVFVRLI